MPEELDDNEKKEAWDVVQRLDSTDFGYKPFGESLTASGFQLHKFGNPCSYKGTYGYVQFEWLILACENRVVKCVYIPLADPGKAYSLETEGVSSSGKSFSPEDMKLLKKERYKQIERFVKNTFEEQVFKPVELNMKIRDDLELDEYDIPEIIMKLENEFGCIITDEEALRFGTVEDVISFIRKGKEISA